MMRWWQRLFGRDDLDEMAVSKTEALDALAEVRETNRRVERKLTRLVDQERAVRETGLTPVDMIRGVYRPQERRQP